MWLLWVFLLISELAVGIEHTMPNCTSFHRIEKKTSAKAGTCVMVKDEAGFISEFMAYYVVHGFSHIIFYDDKSSDGGLKELDPWIERGYASIRKDWEGYYGPEKATTWGKQMSQKKMMERDCKMHLHHIGMDYHISVDVDEYEMPVHPGVTLVDALDDTPGATLVLSDSPTWSSPRKTLSSPTCSSSSSPTARSRGAKWPKTARSCSRCSAMWWRARRSAKT